LILFDKAIVMDFLTPESYWLETSLPDPTPQATALPDRVDVAVIGAGITGLTAALHLHRAGARVAVIEAGCVGAGASSGTSGHLDADPDQGARKLIADFGDEAARSMTHARMAAIQQIEDWVHAFQIDCDFARVPGCNYAEDPQQISDLDAEAEAMGKLGLSIDTAMPIGLPFRTAGGFRIANQARFHPVNYLRGLAQQLPAGSVFQHLRAEPPEDGKPCTVKTERGPLKADRVLVCTHSAYFGASELDIRVAPYQSYVLVARVEEDLPDGLFWDQMEPYHYWRRATGHDPHLVIVGGADHKTGQQNEQQALSKLEHYLRQRMNVVSIESRWSSEYFEPIDHLPFIGLVPGTKHLYVATGLSGTGLTFGTMAGQILADLALGRDCPLADIVTPSRVNVMAGAKTFLFENTNVAIHFVMDRFKGDAHRSPEDLRPGEGALLMQDGQQIAAYRDPQGKLFLKSPVCTHLGCHVAWNELESTWDCPCHGGRYAATGERLYGPPPHDLDPAPQKK
jgi:glycine/D-amino acid oxidase-like deaminating enzyme/nitrite reductase/ring-hydroxylating ferredoxin subunit